MSLNWKEIGLVLSELPLEGSTIQNVIQHDFHCISWQLYHPMHGRWTLYTEIGTPNSRLHLLSSDIAATQSMKTAKLQRFIQFTRKNLDGSRITSCSQIPFDRLVLLKLDNHGSLMNLYLRFYSGSQANIIITDEKNCILDLLYRRPSRNEKSGAILVLDPQKKEETKEFAIRNRTEGSFNKQIEAEYGAKSNDESMQSLIARVSQRRDRELKKIETTVRTLSLKVSANAQYELYKQLGDLLSYNKHIITDHSKSVLVDDYLTGQKREIALDAKLNASANIQAYYNKYQRAKGTWQDSENEYKKAIAYLKERQGHYQQILSPCPDSVEMIRRLQGELEELTVDKAIGKSSPGLVFHSGKFTILVGRNAKENDQLLRHWVKSYDFWMHTRDYPGGYVFIKAMKNKSIPLEALLDAANLAVLYSKAKGQPKVDLYYTQVKFLRRAKDGPLGLVLPTQEKNFAVALDDNRIKRLLSEGDEHANE